MQDLVYPNERVLRTIALIVAILIWLALLIGTVGIVIVWVLALALAGLIAHSALIAYLRGNAIRISQRQFPDLDARVRRCSSKLGMAQVPEAYLVNGNGILNAFATHFLGRNFVVLLSDVVDSMDDRPGALDFYIGHELGHLSRRHLTWSRILAPALFLPLLGAAYSRACEYTCDRHGLAVCDDPEDAQYGLAALAAGKRRWRQVDLEEYSDSAALIPGFWMSLHELLADYPWLNKRHAWLRALAGKGRPKLGRRNPLAWILSALAPRVPGTGAGGVLVVVAMVAVLAAIAIPAYQDYVGRAAASVGLSDSAPYRHAVAQYAIVHRQWPQALDQTGVAAFPGDREVKTIELGERGLLTVRFKAPPLKGKALTLTPYVHDHAIHWSCGGSVPVRLMPVACRNL